MVYNKSTNPKLQLILTYYVDFSSQLCQLHNLNLNNYIKAYMLQIYIFFFSKNKIYAGHIKYIA